uniref:AH domain-containing protein n=1 Tax=Denticeps clupeoides TaxID=299321 RepID=A0AAY4AH34_9TELE
MDGYGDMSGGRTVLGEDSSVMGRMQKKFWKTKQVLIRATGKKEDEYVVASDADLDAKLEFFRSVQATCTELLKVIEKYQQRITYLSQEENELGLFLRFQAQHDKTKAGSMMEATSKALCTSAKQRLALCPPLHRMEQEVETFRRRAIADTLLTMSRMEKSRTEYRGALLWMKDVSQELDPDTYKQLEKFRKVQTQVRTTKVQFDKLKNDVCQKVDMLGASRCNMLSHSLCTYQTTLLQFWEKTAHMMTGIHDAFKGYVPYQFTMLKELRDPLDHLTEEQMLGEKEGKKKAIHKDNDMDVVFPTVSAVGPDGLSRDSDSSLCASLDSDLSQLQPSPVGVQSGDEAEDRGDLLFLKELLSPGVSSSDEFTQAWQDAFGCFESPAPTGASQTPPTSVYPAPKSDPDSPTGFLPSQLLDHSLSSTGWATPPMFQAPSLQPPATSSHDPLPQTSSKTSGNGRDMSAWYNLFADLDPLSNPDAIGRTDEELLNA